MKITNIQKAMRIAENSDYSIRIGCVVTNKRGRIISQGFNQLKSHPKQARYAKLHGKCEKIFLHAEISALVRCREEPHTIYVGRIMKNGLPGMCKPCPICEAAIREAGVKYMIYTDASGQEISIRL